jgi:hypothetical protein
MLNTIEQRQPAPRQPLTIMCAEAARVLLQQQVRQG